MFHRVSLPFLVPSIGSHRRHYIASINMTIKFSACSTLPVAICCSLVDIPYLLYVIYFVFSISTSRSLFYASFSIFCHRFLYHCYLCRYDGNVVCIRNDLCRFFSNVPSNLYHPNYCPTSWFITIFSVIPYFYGS